MNTVIEGEARVVTFGNGMVVRESIISIDEARHRVAWSATGEALAHHNASAQAFTDGDAHTRIVWIADLLPHEMAKMIEPMMDEGMRVMKMTLET